MSTVLVDLVTLECWWRKVDGGERCGRFFGITPRTHDWMREEGGRVHCPAGHSIHYSDTEISQLKNQLARERAQHDQTRAALQSAELETKKLKKRVVNGVCPCCNRSFVASRAPHENEAPRIQGQEVMCECPFSSLCNLERQRVAVALGVTPTECIIFPGMLTHVNPNSRSEMCEPF